MASAPEIAAAWLRVDEAVHYYECDLHNEDLQMVRGCFSDDDFRNEAKKAKTEVEEAFKALAALMRQADSANDEMRGGT